MFVISVVSLPFLLNFCSSLNNRHHRFIIHLLAIFILSVPFLNTSYARRRFLDTQVCLPVNLLNPGLACLTLFLSPSLTSVPCCLFYSLAFFSISRFFHSNTFHGR